MSDHTSIPHHRFVHPALCKLTVQFPLNLFLATILLFATLTPVHIAAEVSDPMDPFDFSGSFIPFDEDDEGKDPDQLVLEGALLFDQERLLDGRTKLLKALAKDPKHLQAHLMLGGYYLVHVGHFRLALRYILQAMEIFTAANGKPPYSALELRAQHAQILYLMSQARLDLDNYNGALEVLDEFSSWGYHSAWYPSSRAWILMKLGRLDEAIRVARLGILTGSDSGRALNMLGILLSMHGDTQESLQVFREAIEYEFSQGPLGQPATPLNNSGEVFREMFQEDRAESAWLRATSLPDGCEHVLPSLNLAFLYIEQINIQGAKRAIDSFEACVAQYPLRNGEEHRALVHLARGRIALHSGYVEEAITHLDAALKGRQWFGKIGTNPKDLEAAVLTSLSQAYRAKRHHTSRRIPESFRERVAKVYATTELRVQEWWLRRRALLTLTEDLNDLEDIEIRNTDSMLEYPTFGEILAALPTAQLRHRLVRMEQQDQRPEARAYYRGYLAENMIRRGNRREGFVLSNQTIASLRPRFDDLLRVQLLLVRLANLDEDSPEYATIASDIYSHAKPQLRNHGLRLPVRIESSDEELLSVIEESAFFRSSAENADFILRHISSGEDHVLEFASTRKKSGTIRVSGNDRASLLNSLMDEVFSTELQ